MNLVRIIKRYEGPKEDLVLTKGVDGITVNGEVADDKFNIMDFISNDLSNSKTDLYFRSENIFSILSINDGSLAVKSKDDKLLSYGRVAGNNMTDQIKNAKLVVSHIENNIQDYVKA